VTFQVVLPGAHWVPSICAYLIRPEKRDGGSKPIWTSTDPVWTSTDPVHVVRNRTIYISMHDSDIDEYEFLTEGHLNLTDTNLGIKEEKIIEFDEPDEEYILKKGGNITITITCHDAT
jgi:hypothetical protein